MRDNAIGKTIAVEALLLVLLVSPAWAGVVIRVGTKLLGIANSRVTELESRYGTW